MYVYQKQLLFRQRCDETGISIHFASLIANDKHSHCHMYKKGRDALSNVAVELFAEKQIPGDEAFPKELGRKTGSAERK